MRLLCCCQGEVKGKGMRVERAVACGVWTLEECHVGPARKQVGTCRNTSRVAARGALETCMRALRQGQSSAKYQREGVMLLSTLSAEVRVWWVVGAAGT